MMNGKDGITSQFLVVTPLWLCVSVIHLGSSTGPSIIILAAGDFH